VAKRRGREARIVAERSIQYDRDAVTVPYELYRCPAGLLHCVILGYESGSDSPRAVSCMMIYRTVRSPTASVSSRKRSNHTPIGTQGKEEHATFV